MVKQNSSVFCLRTLTSCFFHVSNILIEAPRPKLKSIFPMTWRNLEAFNVWWQILPKHKSTLELHITLQCLHRCGTVKENITAQPRILERSNGRWCQTKSERDFFQQSLGSYSELHVGSAFRTKTSPKSSTSQGIGGQSSYALDTKPIQGINTL